MPAGTNPTGAPPAAQPGTEDPRNWLGPPPLPSAVDDNLCHPSASVISATMARTQATTAQAALTSGTLQLVAIGIRAGSVLSNATMFTNTTAKTGGTHGWYVLADNTLTVIAVTADQTDAATVWGVASTGYTLPFASPAIALYTGLYYVGVMVAETAGQMPTFTGCATLAVGMGAGTGITSAQKLAGASNTGATTPPAVGTALTAITAASNLNPYAYLT
jgi:hypothetical protein